MKNARLYDKLLWVESSHKSIENIERHIATQRQKLDYHHKKWNKLITVL